MLERRAWARQHQDHLRRALMFEPRGHLDMYGALLTEPERADSHAGVLFMHNEGFSTMCGHGIIAVVTIALERDLIAPGGEPGVRRARRARRPDSSARGTDDASTARRACRACHLSMCRRSCSRRPCR